MGIKNIFRKIGLQKFNNAKEQYVKNNRNNISIIKEEIQALQANLINLQHIINLISVQRMRRKV